MKQLQANNYSNAQKELEAIEKGLGGKVSEQVSPNDSKHYHVALVRIFDKPGEAKNEVSVVLQKYHKEAFEKLEKNFMFQGIHKLVIVHDPTKEIAEAQGQQPTASTGTQTKTAEEIEAEIKAGIEAGISARLELIKNDSGTAGEGAGTQTKTAEELRFDTLVTEGKVDELKAYATEKEIDLTGVTDKKSIVLAITAWGEDPENKK